MSLHLDPKKILSYLNDLGFYNITAVQLKDFIRDLKILIKHDQKLKEKENIENVNPKQNELYSKFLKEFHEDAYNRRVQTNIPEKSTIPDSTPQLTRNSNISDTFETLHSTSTVSSRAKTVPKKKIITVQITKPKPQKCSDDTKNTQTTLSTGYDEVDSRLSENIEPNIVRPCIKSVPRPNSYKDCALKPKVSFIRPRKPASSYKCDPVTLYHQYQAEWKKQKLPGENKHNELRWAIRERMLGGSSIRPQSSHSSKTRSDR